MATLIDSYGVENGDTGWWGFPADMPLGGQSFNASITANLDSVKLLLIRAYGAEGGTCVAHLYAHTGTYGSTGVPTGSPLATSDTVALSSIPDAGGGWEAVIGPWVDGATENSCTEFTFSTPYEIQSGTKYFIILEYTVDNYLLWIVDYTSPTHGGNSAYWDGSWNSWADDLIFYAYGTAASAGGTRSMRQLVGHGQGTRD